MNVLPFPTRSFEIDSFKYELPYYDEERDERVMCGICTVYISDDPFDINWRYHERCGVTFDSPFDLNDDEEYQLFYAVEDYLRDLEFLGALDF